jgi:hypothetical protein
MLLHVWDRGHCDAIIPAALSLMGHGASSVLVGSAGSGLPPTLLNGESSTERCQNLGVLVNVKYVSTSAVCRIIIKIYRTYKIHTYRILFRIPFSRFKYVSGGKYCALSVWI